MNQTSAKIFPTSIPCARAASWSKEVALIATPYLDFLKNTDNKIITRTAVINAEISRYLSTTPPTLIDPKFP